jgi:ATP-dependent RNA helicase RhlE
MDMKPQTLELKRGVEILVATPGRLLDHIEAKNAVLNQVEYVVLDEADRMLDIGFLPDLQRILSYLPKERTTLLFSATFSPEIKRLANSYLQDPVTIEVARPNETASTVEQHFYSVGDEDKRHALKQIVAPARPDPGFCVRQQQAGLCTAGALAGARRPEDHRTARRQEPGRAPQGAGCVQGGRGRPAGVPPTSRRAAWTSRMCRPCSISTFHSMPRTMCTASAAPGVLAHRAWRSPLCRPATAVWWPIWKSCSRKSSSIEAMEFEEDRPRGRINDGRRHWREEGELGDPRDALDAPRAERAPRPPERPRGRPAAAPRDPFFDQPYEAPATEVAPAWEASARPATNRISANIKPKRKVAALFKAE